MNPLPRPSHCSSPRSEGCSCSAPQVGFSTTACSNQMASLPRNSLIRCNTCQTYFWKNSWVLFQVPEHLSALQTFNFVFFAHHLGKPFQCSKCQEPKLHYAKKRWPCLHLASVPCVVVAPTLWDVAMEDRADLRGASQPARR